MTDQKAGQVEEWIRQNNLAYVALIGIGVVMVQPFLVAGDLDISAMVCVIAFGLAIPMLAGLVLVNQHEAFLGKVAPSKTVGVAKSIGQSFALVGITAGFWHIHWLAGVSVLVGGLGALVALSAGYFRLEQPASQDGGGTDESNEPDAQTGAG